MLKCSSSRLTASGGDVGGGRAQSSLRVSTGSLTLPSEYMSNTKQNLFSSSAAVLEKVTMVGGRPGRTGVNVIRVHYVKFPNNQYKIT